LKLSTLALNIPTFDKLLDENKKNLKTIDELKATVARLEMEGVDKIKVVAETHTEHEFIEIPCNECVCMASCQEELDFHLENDHDHEESEEPESPDPNTCNICGKRNKNKGELLSHIKSRHPETVRTCKFFLQGRCDFPESVCWFMHTQTSTASSPQTLKSYKCGICDKDFPCKSNFMKHRKREHEEFVPLCRDNTNGSCAHDSDSCWFKHNAYSNESINMESSDMIKRLFEMMENFTERISEMEKQLYNENI
jgi:hypothetical protein